jgi:3-hexulose-6-phosphate synthase
VRLQLALDAPEHLSLVRRLAPHVDLIEVGTPLLKRFGLAVVTTVLELGGGRDVVVDTKTADGGALEAEMVFAAGARMMTVLAGAAPATVEAASRVAARHGCQVVLDTVLEDPAALPRLPRPGSGAGEVWVGLHRGVDRRAAGPVADLVGRAQELRRRGYRIAVAGGIGPADVEHVIEARPDVIVLGSAVTAAADPEPVLALLAEKVAAR